MDPTTPTGIAVALAKLEMAVSQASKDVREARDDARTAQARLEGELLADMKSMKDRHRADTEALAARIKPLEDAVIKKSGVTWTWKTALAVIATGATLLTIISLLLALLSQGPGP
jgi:hypothetical protein